jgi:flagellin
MMEWGMTVIGTNVAALNAEMALTKNSRDLQSAMEKLSTGKRINAASDDAAGIAEIARMSTEISGIGQAIKNANDGISILKTSDSATGSITNMLQRMRELAIQAANGTNASSDIQSLNTEYQQLYSEIKRVSSTTEWNSSKLLDGTFSAGISLFVGYSSNSDGTITASIPSFDPTAGATNSLVDGFSAISGSSISAGSNATDLLAKLSLAISGVNKVRSTLGATVNRLQFTVDNLTNMSTSIYASRSQIQDVDYSQATADLARGQILQQAATAMLAQANQQPQLVLALLK